MNPKLSPLACILHVIIILHLSTLVIFAITNWLFMLQCSVVQAQTMYEKDLVQLVRDENVSEVANVVLDVLDPEVRLRALAEAARLGQLECVRVLLDAGIDPTLKHAGRTALYWAVRANNVEIIQAMLEWSSFGLDLGLDTRQTQRSQVKVNTAASLAMFEAASHGEVESLEVFLKTGINPNFYQYHDSDSVSWCTPLIASCYAFYGRKGPIEKYSRTARLLIEHGADVTVASCYGETALHYAISNKMEDVVKELLRNGADVNRPNGTGKVPLTCIPDDKCLSTQKLLLDWGADVNIGDADGWTSLHFMCAQGNVALVENLLEHRADPNICEEKSVAPTTALALAIQSECARSIDIVRLLIAYNCDVNQLSYPRHSPDGSPFYMVCYYTFNALMAEMVAAAGVHRNLIKQTFQSSILYRDIKNSGLEHGSHWLALQAYIHHPRSLRHECRLLIRRLLRGPKFLDRHKLPLPPYLISYLTIPELDSIIKGISQILML